MLPSHPPPSHSIPKHSPDSPLFLALCLHQEPYSSVQGFVRPFRFLLSRFSVLLLDTDTPWWKQTRREIDLDTGRKSWYVAALRIFVVDVFRISKDFSLTCPLFLQVHGRGDASMACRARFGSLPRPLVPSSLHVLGVGDVFEVYPYKNLPCYYWTSLVCVSHGTATCHSFSHLSRMHPISIERDSLSQGSERRLCERFFTARCHLSTLSLLSTSCDSTAQRQTGRPDDYRC